MRIDDALLQQTTATRFLRDLADATGLDEGDPALQAAFAAAEAAWGHRPDAELRRFLGALGDDSLGAARFAREAPPAGANAWVWMVEQAHAHTDQAGAATAALHGALPIGWLPRAGARLHLSVLLADRWGLKAGRVLAHGAPTAGAVARLEKRLGTFALRLAQDAAADADRYGTEPLEAWHTRGAWIGQALEGGGPPDHLDDAELLRLIPALDDAAVTASLASGPDRLALAWRAWLLGEDAILDAALAALDDGVRLEADAAALLGDLRNRDADALGPLTGLRSLRAGLRARASALHDIPDPPLPAARVEAPVPEAVDEPAPEPPPAAATPAPGTDDPTALPEPASLPDSPPDDPFSSAPTHSGGGEGEDEGETTDIDEGETVELPGTGPQPGDPIPGPPPGGWPTHRDTYRSPVSPAARYGFLLALTAVVLGLAALCCGGLS